MKKLQLLLAFTLLSVQFLFAQNKVEILLNGTVQTLTNEAIRLNSDDKIEFRIYFDSKVKKESLIDSVKIVGCNQYQTGGNVQQQNNNSNSKLSIHQEKWITYLKPKFNSTYLSFEFNVGQVTFCQGEHFNLILLFDKSKSSLATFNGYKAKYKLYWVS